MPHSGAFLVVMLKNVTSGSSPAHNCIVTGVRDLTLYLAGTGTISSGTVVVEEAAWNDGFYGGTQVDPPTGAWSSVTGISPLTASDVSGGAQKAYQLPPGSYAFVRVRCSVAIGGGGTLTAMLVGC